MSETSKPPIQDTIGPISIVPESTSTLESNKALVRRLVEELHNKHNLAIAPTLIANEVSLRHSMLETEVTGLDEVRRNAENLHTGFPDLKATIQSIVAEGDMVAYVVHFEGTHTGAFHGRQPCGSHIDWTAMHVATIRDGKIVDLTECDNLLSRMQQVKPES